MSPGLALSAAAGATAILAAGWLAERRRAPLTEAIRAQAPGRIVDLPPGRVHLRAWGGEGEAARPAPVPVYGLSMPSGLRCGRAEIVKTARLP